MAKVIEKSKALSKFEPRPAGARPPPESAKANTRDAGPPGVLKTGISQPKGETDDDDGRAGNFLQLGGGYKIRVNAGSGYCVFLSIMAKRGGFEECAAILGSKDFDPSNKGQASALLSKMMVPLADVEDLVRQDPTWRTHQQYRTTQLSKRAAGGHEQTKKVIENEARVRDGKWQGNVREIVSTCRGSYNPEAKNKNVDKFREAGIVFRLFPLKPKRSDKVQALLMPAEYAAKVKAAIKTVHGVDE
jgi:hypothetical protein